jgi:hypothetical protein
MMRLAAGLGFLILLFLPGPAASGIWPTLVPRLPIEALLLATAVVLPRLFGRRAPAWLRGVLALGGLLLAVLGFVDVEAPALIGRDIDLSADLPHAGSAVALFAAAAGPAQILLAALAGILVPVLLLTVTFLALSAVERGAAASRSRIALLFATTALAVLVSGSSAVSDRALAAAERQAGRAEEAWQAAHGDRTALIATLGPAPRRDADLARLGGRDVYLIFFESYGAVLLDEPALKGRALPATTQFGQRLADAGFTLRSARIASPTYGGGSWLAHGTVDSGAWLNSQLRYDLLTSTDRTSWPRLMAQAGYQTVDAQPGLKVPLESAGYWGFGRMVGTDDLDYHGPNFGWFGLPDQFSLGKIGALPREPGKPLFEQIVLLSSHVPFSPVPPYVEDWADAEHFASHPEVAAVLPPDWQHLATPYLDAVAYDLRVLADWIPRAVQGNALVIILGDHQPPALIGAASASHDVPIHILSRDPAIVRLLAGPGYVDGAIPANSVGRMDALLPRFLDALSSPRVTESTRPG